MPAKKPGAVKVNAENNKPLMSTTKFVCETTGGSLYRNQIGTFYPLGGEKIRVEPSEVKKMKEFDLNGMQLLGFKAMSTLKIYHNLRHSYFIFPDDKKSQGSSQCADALIKEMLAADKYAMVKFVPRENSMVRLCALLPQEEKVD